VPRQSRGDMCAGHATSTVEEATMNKQRWNNLLIGIAGGAIGALVVGTGLPGRLRRGGVAEAAVHHHARTIVADNFILVDRFGRKRAELHIESGEPLLTFYGPNGRTVRDSIGISPRGVARARFYSSTGIPQAAIGVTNDGKSGMALLDRQRHLRGTFEVSMDGEPTLRLYDEKRPRIGLDVTAAGSPGLALLDNAGKTRAALSLGSSGGNPALTMYDAAGNLERGLP
jgi:hypothetical protein